MEAYGGEALVWSAKKDTSIRADLKHLIELSRVGVFAAFPEQGINKATYPF